MRKKSDIAAKAAADKTLRPERNTLKENRNMIYEKFRRNCQMLFASEFISSVELAEKIGLESGVRVEHLKWGRAHPSVEELILIGKYFNIDLDSLMHKKAKITFE